MISWQRLGDAIAHYRHLGYEEIETPWAVNREASDVTRPPGRPNFDMIAGDDNYGALVASAEQGFIHLRMFDVLEPGRYISCGPCFRNEPVIDETHRLYFMKAELIDTVDVSRASLHRMMGDAMETFKKLAPYEVWSDIKIVPTGMDEFDIEAGGIEIGSYGIRDIPGFSWVYGTGLAEPRFGQAIARLRSKNSECKSASV
jgi:seryl-tRNA synthetase